MLNIFSSDEISEEKINFLLLLIIVTVLTVQQHCAYIFQDSLSYVVSFSPSVCLYLYLSAALESTISFVNLIFKFYF